MAVSFFMIKKVTDLQKMIKSPEKIGIDPWNIKDVKRHGKVVTIYCFDGEILRIDFKAETPAMMHRAAVLSQMNKYRTQ